MPAVTYLRPPLHFQNDFSKEILHCSKSRSGNSAEQAPKNCTDGNMATSITTAQQVMTSPQTTDIMRAVYGLVSQKYGPQLVLSNHLLPYLCLIPFPPHGEGNIMNCQQVSYQCKLNLVMSPHSA